MVCREWQAWRACLGSRAWPVACRDWRVPFLGPFCRPFRGWVASQAFHPDVQKACPCREPWLGLRARRAPLWLRAGRGVYRQESPGVCHRECQGDPLRVLQVFQAGRARGAPPQEACPESHRQAPQVALRQEAGQAQPSQVPGRVFSGPAAFLRLKEERKSAPSTGMGGQRWQRRMGGNAS